jgi:hypothetical protein
LARAEQRPRRLGDEHLAAVGRCHHACGLVDVDSHIVSVDRPRLAGVKAHADADRVTVGPLLFGERLLRPLGRRCRSARGLEGGEEAVALAGEHMPAVALERPTEELPVPRELLVIAVSQPPEQTRRALDVAEQQRDGAAGRLGHGASIAPVPRSNQGAKCRGGGRPRPPPR